MFESVIQNKLLRKFLPFCVLIVGGSFVLRQCTTLRFEYGKKTQVTKEEKEEIDKLFNKTKTNDIEEEYEKLLKTDLQNWENKRIPRPWESEEQK